MNTNALTPYQIALKRAFLALVDDSNQIHHDDEKQDWALMRLWALMGGGVRGDFLFMLWLIDEELPGHQTNTTVIAMKEYLEGAMALLQMEQDVSGMWHACESWKGALGN